MTDARAQDYMKRATAVDQQLLELRMKYVPVFEKVISAKKTALWYQIDRHIDLLINLQLSGNNSDGGHHEVALEPESVGISGPGALN